MLTKIGIPIIQSNCDAEKTCSLLTNEKKVNAAYSSDTDLFIIGCRIVITDIEHVVENKERKIVVTFVEHKDILNSLEITSEQLKEFGILCGTDYNLNIHGIGPVKALSLIKNYGTIENSISNICPSEDEICNLNVDICKKIFTECKCEETVEGEINLNINKEIIKTEGIQFLNDFGLYEYYQKIINNFDI
jgi:5'-3' exonuclease